MSDFWSHASLGGDAMDGAGQRLLIGDSSQEISQVTERVRRRGKARGYSVFHLPDHVQAELKALEATSPIASIWDAALYFVSIVLLAMFCIAVWELSAPWGVFVYGLALLLIARQQRGLELMVHDASHWAFDRDNKPRNDALADYVVSYPTLQSIQAYRRGHFIHHGTFAGEQDPCKRRFQEMGLGHVDLSSKWKIMWAVLRWLPSYNLTYYAEIGSKSGALLARWAIWHVVVLLLPLSLAVGVVEAMMLWGLFWLVPMLVSLPVLRSIAEAEEHDYEHGDTEFEATYTNDGLIHHLLWHPWNDGYHQIHHLFPTISARHHHIVHDLLMKHDPLYRESPMRYETLKQAARA
jgi:fatty acid desaturase